MKVGELIQRVKLLYSKGASSDDARLTAPHIYNKLLTTRSLLLVKKLKAKSFISDFNYNTLRCIELITVDKNGCSCIPHNRDKILRSRYKLPNIIAGYSNNAIKSVFTNDMTSFKYMSPDAMKYIEDSRFSKVENYYFIENGFLYVVTRNELLKVINVTALWEDILAVNNFHNYCYGKAREDYYSLCSTSGCNDICVSNFDVEFNIDAELIDILLQEAYRELVQLFSMIKSDDSNDTSDSKTGNNAQQVSNGRQQQQ